MTGIPEPGASTGSARVAVSGGRLFRRNYFAYAMEGIFFGVGMSFVDVGTLLPPIVKSLGGSLWLISLTPMLLQLTAAPALLLTMPIVERLHRYAPYIRATMIVQRLPYLLAALCLFFASSSPTLALAAVMLAPVIAGFGQGLTSNAWMNLLVVTIPGNRRSSLMAVRNGVSAAAGVGVGYLVKLILARYPGSDGYAVLHLLTSLCVAISLGFFLLARDPPHQPRPSPDGGMLRSWARMAAALAHDRPFRRFLMGIFFQCGTFVLIPFLAINALEVLQRPQSYLGQLLMLQTSGAIAGNIAAGFVGDRFGGKTAILAGMLIFIALAAGSAMASTDIETSAVFLMLGFAFPMIGVGGFTMGTELCPEGNRPAYLALLAMVGMPGMLLASVVSSTMWSWGLGIWPLAVTTMASLGLSLALLLPIRERRQRASA